MKKVRFQKPIIIATEAKLSDSADTRALLWLQGVLEDDRSLTGRIYTRDYWCSLSGIQQTDPFIDLGCGLINAAVFALLLKGVTGRLWVDGQQCGQLAEFIGGGPRVPHGESTNVTIRQRLSKEMVAPILAFGDSQEAVVKVSLDYLRLIVQSDIPGEASESVELKVGSKFVVKGNLNSATFRMETSQTD